MTITEKQIAQAKKKHGEDLYIVEVQPQKKGDPKLQFLIKSADRKIMSAAAKAGQDDNLKEAEIVLKNTLILGDREALKNDKVFFSVVEHLEKINEPRKSTLKKI